MMLTRVIVLMETSGIERDRVEVELTVEEYAAHFLGPMDRAITECGAERARKGLPALVARHNGIEEGAAAVWRTWHGFGRIDDESRSTVRCACGESFTWEGVSDRLHPWLDEHIPHVAAARERHVQPRR
jgi:hypothetical protein